MPFANGFNGDVVTLNYILQTLEAKIVAIDGVTCNPSLSVSANGETAYYYTRGATTVKKGKLGQAHDYTSSGLTRKSIDITDSINIDVILPKVNVDTVTPDLVADKVIQETIEQANLYNQYFLEALYDTTSTAISGEALTADSVYQDIVNSIKSFKITNKKKGMKPTAIIVGPTTYALLLNAPQFARSVPSGDVTVFEGKVGSVSGIPVIEGLDLDETTNKIDYILMNAEGFAAPTNISSLVITDATAAKYPGGTLIAGEMGYAFQIADNDLIILRKHA